MRLIQQITADPSQNQTLILDDGTRVQINLYFRLSQTGWFIRSMVYGSQTYSEIRITTSFNFLHQIINLIPFGIGCFTIDGNDPLQMKDFSSGYAKLYLLSQAETQQFSEFLSGQV